MILAKGTVLAAKLSPARPILATKVVRDQLWKIFAKISPAGPILGGTDFGVTGRFLNLFYGIQVLISFKRYNLTSN